MKCFGDKGKILSCKIILLDEQELLQEVPDETFGQTLLTVVFQHLNLLETSYFGLRYIDQYHQNHWLDPKKKISKQLKGSLPFAFYFSVKFYAADPTKLVEELTRYQFFLQIKQDILQGRLSVPIELVVELGALAVQSELGDYDARRHSPGYISEFRLTSCQNADVENKISDVHKSYVGQVPAKAEVSFLEKVKWLDMYGVDLHPVLGEDNTEYFLGLTPTGIIVLRNKAKVGNYFWPRITKVYFRGLFFMLRVKDKSSTENTYGFETPSKSACKHLWKCCVEHHAFFRLTQSAGNTPQAIFSLGSKFRYSGRTEKEVQQDAKQNGRPRVEFSRSPSRRYQGKNTEVNSNEDTLTKTEIRTVVSLPSSVQSGSQQVYRSTSLTMAPRNVSPHSTRSAPFHSAERRQSASTNGNPDSPPVPRNSRPPSRSHSPRSAKSSSVGRYKRTSSVESQSSVDSRSCHRRQGRSRCKSSDGESEVSSKCSSRGHRRHKHRRRHRQHSEDSSGQKHHRRRHRHRSVEKNVALIESSMQWAKVQAGETPAKGHQATVRNLAGGYSPVKSSHGDTDSCKRHKKPRSCSPSELKKRIPDEIRRHIDFDLQTPVGLSESQLKEIPYTNVNSGKNRHSRSPKRKKSPRRNINENETNAIQKKIDMELPISELRVSDHPNHEKLPIQNGIVERHSEMNSYDVTRNSENFYQNGQVWNAARSSQVNTLPKRSQLMPLTASTPHFEQNGPVNNVVWAKPPMSSQDSGHGRLNGYTPPHPDSPESGIDQFYRNSASSNYSGAKDYNEEISPSFVDSYNQCYMRQNRISRNSSEETHSILKPQPSPQSSVTSGISVGSSSVSIPVAEYILRDVRVPQVDTKLSNYLGTDQSMSYQVNNAMLREPHYMNSNFHGNNIKHPKKSRRPFNKANSLLYSDDLDSDHTVNRLTPISDSETFSAKGSKAPTPLPRSSIATPISSSGSFVDILDSCGPSYANGELVDHLQLKSFPTLPRNLAKHSETSFNNVSPVTAINTNKCSTLPRLSYANSNRKRDAENSRSVLTNALTRSTHSVNTTLERPLDRYDSVTHDRMMYDRMTNDRQFHTLKKNHREFKPENAVEQDELSHWKVANWDTGRHNQNMEPANQSSSNKRYYQEMGHSNSVHSRGSAGSLELILGPLIQSALQHQRR